MYLTKQRQPTYDPEAEGGRGNMMEKNKAEKKK